MLAMVTTDEDQDSVERDFTAMFAGSDEWREGLAKVKGVDFFERERIVLHRAKMSRVRPGAGAKWLQGDCIHTRSPKNKHEQPREHGFAHASVGAADDNDVRAQCQFMLSTWTSRGELRRSTAV
ncbi:MAG TPA: hypothetical protein VJ063_15960 [Verrucomicrobiae bacterium]|nr:hypothetical protein [Verrucomicrobiae bacterium]